MSTYTQDRLASRRLQLLLLDPAYLRSMLDGAISLRLDLPADATILSIHADEAGIFLWALVHSAAFAEMPPGERPPHWEGRWTHEPPPQCSQCVSLTAQLQDADHTAIRYQQALQQIQQVLREAGA